MLITYNWKNLQALDFEFSLGKRSDDDVLDSLIQLIAIKLTGKEYISDESRNKYLLLIKQEDIKTYEVLAKFMEAFTVYSFLKSDKDLRLKSMDVWKEEKEKHKIEYLGQLDNIFKLFIENKWNFGDLEEELKAI